MATEYDEYLFISCAAPNTVNMSAGRNDSRVEKMLQQRDSGQTPSVCSTMTATSKQTAVTQQVQVKSKVVVPSTSSLHMQRQPPGKSALLNTVSEVGGDADVDADADVDVGRKRRSRTRSRSRSHSRSHSRSRSHSQRDADTNNGTENEWDTSPIIPTCPPTTIATKLRRQKHLGRRVLAVDADTNEELDFSGGGVASNEDEGQNESESGSGKKTRRIKNGKAKGKKKGHDTVNRQQLRRSARSPSSDDEFDGNDYHQPHQLQLHTASENDGDDFREHLYEEGQFDDAASDVDGYRDSPVVTKRTLANKRHVIKKEREADRSDYSNGRSGGQDSVNDWGGSSAEPASDADLCEPAAVVSSNNTFLQRTRMAAPRRQETAYEKTYREMMEPKQPRGTIMQREYPFNSLPRVGGMPVPMPVPPVTPRRVLSVRSQSSVNSQSEAASAVESSVSHPNHSSVRRQQKSTSRTASRKEGSSSKGRGRGRGRRRVASRSSSHSLSCSRSRSRSSSPPQSESQSRTQPQNNSSSSSSRRRNSNSNARDLRTPHPRHRSSRRGRRSSNDSRLAEIERENKMELLIELEKLQAMGVMLSFSLSMDEPEWKLKHELERHLAHQTLVQRVTLIKGVLKIGSIIIRVLCSSFLGLDGWDAFIAKELDSGKYDTSLEQVYRQLFRKGTPNPWFNLGLLVIGSAIAFHVGSIMSNGQTATGSSSGASGVIGGILTSLFGAGTAASTPAGNGNGNGNAAAPGGMFSGGLPMSIIGNVLRSAGGGAPTRATIPPPPPPPLRPVMLPPAAATPTNLAAAAPAAEQTHHRTRPRIPPPML